eukprot:Trichotokara_eunicae@DN4769_c0_g1_i1.p1
MLSGGVDTPRPLRVGGGQSAAPPSVPMTTRSPRVVRTNHLPRSAGGISSSATTATNRSASPMTFNTRGSSNQHTKGDGFAGKDGFPAGKGEVFPPSGTPSSIGGGVATPAATTDLSGGQQQQGIGRQRSRGVFQQPSGLPPKFPSTDVSSVNQNDQQFSGGHQQKNFSEKEFPLSKSSVVEE